jgi:hypothetical protein
VLHPSTPDLSVEICLQIKTESRFKKWNFTSEAAQAFKARLRIHLSSVFSSTFFVGWRMDGSLD